MEQNREKQTIKLSQPAYINKVLIKFYFNKAYVINTPIKKMAIFKQKTEEKTSSSKKKRY